MKRYMNASLLYANQKIQRFFYFRKGLFSPFGGRIAFFYGLTPQA